MNRVLGAVILGASLVVGLAACSSAGDGGSALPSTSQGPLTAPTPTGEPFVIESLDAIDGAEAWTSDGVSIDVPAGMEKKRTVADNGVISLGVFEPGAPQDAVVVTVTPQQDGQDGPYTENSVNQAVDVAGTQLTVAGMTDMSRSPVQWSTWPYAAAVLGSIEQDGVVLEGAAIQAVPSDGAVLVGMTVKAPEGELEESWQYEVLRTVRPA